MGNLLAYSGLTTKIRAMQSNLISEKQYKEIAQLDSVSELFAYLQNHAGYKQLFADMDPSSIHRRDIEAFLSFASFRDFSKLYNFANRKQRKYLDLYFMKYEIEVLKKYLRNVFDSRDKSSVKVVKNDFELHSKIDTKRVAESANIDEFINNLRGTPYFAPLWKLHTLSDLTLFDYEMCLDLFLFSTMWKSKDKFFKGDELKVITHSYGTKIDMLNIMWIYRAKKYFSIASKEIYALLIPIRYKLKRPQIITLVEAEDIEKFYDILKSSYYGKFVKDNGDLRFDELEENVLYTLHMKDFKKNPYSIATVNTYLFLKEREINNLTTIIECIRYGYNPSEILENIV